MDRPWLAERAVSVELASALVATQFPELSPARLELVGVGWDNSVFRTSDGWVFRFPRREVAVRLLQNERGILAAIAPRLPLSIPVVVHAGEATDEFP